MASSRRTRRRHQQVSLRRHQLRLEGLEKRYALDAAPGLDSSASPQLNSVIENAGTPVGQVGTLVSDLIDTGGTHNNFIDADGDPPAIAITGTNLQGGTVHYSTDDGNSWYEVSAVSEEAPLVLYANSDSRLAFTPDVNFHGMISDVLTIKAWSGGYLNGGAVPMVSNFGTPGFLRSTSLSADGNTAYLADEYEGFHIVDVSNPSNPILLGSYDDLIQTFDVTLAPDENTLFTGDSDNGLRVIDITDKSNPILVGQLDDYWEARSVTLSADGNTAYVAGLSDGLFIVDVSDRTNPLLISSLNTYGIALKSMLSEDGTTLYLCDGGFGFEIIDVSDPVNPSRIGTLIDIVASDIAMDFANATAYVMGNSHVQIVDVSEPSIPTIIGSIQRASSNSTGIAIATDRTTVFVAENSIGVRAINVSDPTNPALQSTIPSTHILQDVVLSPDGSTVYVSDGFNGLHITSLGERLSTASDTVSIQIEAGPNEAPILFAQADSGVLQSTPEQGTTPVGSVGTLVSDMVDSDGQYKNFYDPDGDLPGIAIVGAASDVERVWFSLDDGVTWKDAGVPTESSALLLHADTSTRIFLERNSEPVNPHWNPPKTRVMAKLWDRSGGFSSGQSGVDTTDASLTYFTGDPVAAVSPDGSLAVVGGTRWLSFSPSSWINSIRLYDLSSPGSPTLLSELQLDYVGFAIKISPDGKTAYVAGNNEVHVIDITNRSTPSLIATFPNLSESFIHDIALSVSGSIAYVTVSDSRLKVFSVSQPSNPTLLGSFADTNNHGTGVALSPDGQYAYLCGRKLQVIDISVNSSPTLVLEMPLPPGQSFYPNDVEITGDGNTIFVSYINAVNAGILEIIDVSSPTNPTVLVRIDTPTAFSELVLNNDSTNLYVPGGNFHQTYVFDVSDPSSARLASSINHAFDWLSSDEQFLYSERWDHGAVESFGVRVFENAASQLPFSGQSITFYSEVQRAPLIQGFSLPDGAIWDGHPVTVTVNGQFIDADATITLSGIGTILNSYSHGHSLSITHTVASSYTEQIVTIENPDGQTHSLSYTVGQVNYATDNLSVITGNIFGILNEQGNALGRIQWSDNEGHSLDRVAVSSHGDHGRVSLLSLGSNQWAWSYVPKSSFVDSDTFRLRFTDDLGYLTDQTFTVQGSVNLEPIEWSMVINQNVVGSEASYTIAAMDVFGQRISGGVTQITATSSDDSLIQNPSTIYTETNVPSSLSFTPVADANGTATLSIQVEDGGPDNDFATSEDNRQATHQVEVTVLQIISNSGSAILAKDSSDSLYVNTQPVIYNQQQVPEAIFGSSVVSADTSDSENALMLKPLEADAEDPPTHRLLTDETWQINGIFNSLQNASSPVLDLSGREVSGPLNIAAVAGAYEIHGVSNPTLIVRRGQTYTFNLNTAGHPFYLQTVGGGYQSASAYNGGFSENGQTTGEHQWVVPEDAPDEIFYQCEFHPVMFGKIIVVD